MIVYCGFLAFPPVSCPCGKGTAGQEALMLWPFQSRSLHRRGVPLLTCARTRLDRCLFLLFSPPFLRTPVGLPAAPGLLLSSTAPLALTPSSSAASPSPPSPRSVIGPLSCLHLCHSPRASQRERPPLTSQCDFSLGSQPGLNSRTLAEGRRIEGQGRSLPGWAGVGGRPVESTLSIPGREPVPPGRGDWSIGC